MTIITTTERQFQKLPFFFVFCACALSFLKKKEARKLHDYNHNNRKAVPKGLPFSLLSAPILFSLLKRKKQENFMTIITTTERQFQRLPFFFVFRAYALSFLKKKEARKLHDYNHNNRKAVSKDCLFSSLSAPMPFSFLKKKKNFALQNTQFIPMRVYRLFIKKRECNYIRVFLF